MVFPRSAFRRGVDALNLAAIQMGERGRFEIDRIDMAI